MPGLHRHAPCLWTKDLLQTDKQELLPLPGRRFDTSDTTECRVSQYATIRYASNKYSVPVAMAGRNVTVKAFAETIQVFEDAQLVATHERCCGKRQKCLQLAHYLPLLEKRPRSILQASGIGTEPGSPALIKEYKFLRQRAHGNSPALHRRRRKGLLAQESGIP